MNEATEMAARRDGFRLAIVGISLAVLLMSCSNMLTGNEIKKSIGEEVAEANAEIVYATILVDPDIPGGTPSLTGRVAEKVGVRFSLSTTVLSAYAFKNWSQSGGGEVVFSDPTLSTTYATITKSAPDIEIQANYYERPTLSISSPPNNSIGQLVSKKISVEFSQAMEGSTISLDSIRVYEKSPLVPDWTDQTTNYFSGVTALSTMNYELGYNPGKMLEANYNYKVVLLKSITDDHDVSLERPITIYFVTGLGSDTTKPVINHVYLGKTPAGTATSLATNSQDIRIYVEATDTDNSGNNLLPSSYTVVDSTNPSINSPYPYQAQWETYSLSTNSEGIHTLSVVAYDSSDIPSVVTNVVVNLDTSAPNAAAVTGASGTRTAVVSVGLGATTDVGSSGIAGYAITASATAPGSYTTAWAGGATTGSYTIPAPSSGTTYTYYVHVFDLAGNSTPSAVQAVLYDALAPNATAISAATAINTTDLSVSLGATSDAGGSGIAGYAITASATAPGSYATAWGGASTTGSYPLPSPASGTSYTYYVHVFDAAGNTRSSTAQTVLYDAAPPSATAISAPAAVNTSSVSVGMGATSDSGGSAVAGYAITASATAPGSYATAWAGGATTGSYALPSPASGTSYTYYLHVFDTLGNVRSSAAQTVVYDTDDPNATAISAPAAVKAAGVSVGLGATTDVGSSGIAGYAITASATAPGSYTTAWAGGATTGSYTIPSPSSGTSYTYYVHVFDAAKNTRSSTAQTVLYDTGQPGVTAISAATAINTTDLSVSLGATTDTGGSGIAGYAITASATAPGSYATAWAGGATTGSYALPTPVSGTSYTYYVHVFDAAGNTRSSTARTVLYDAAPPNATAISAPAAVNTSSVSVGMGATSDTGGSAVAGYAITASATAPGSYATAWAGGATTGSYALPSPASGTSYTYYLHVFDTLGNVRSSAAQTVVYDTDDPNATAISAPAAVKAAGVSVGLGATTDVGSSGIAGYAITASATAPGSYTTAWAGGATTGSYTIPSPSSGTSYTYYVHVFDAAKNTRSSTAQTVLYDTGQPGVTAISAATAINTTDLSVSLGATTDTGGSGIAGYAITASATAPGSYATAWAGGATTGSYALPTPVSGTSYTYYVHVFDAAGNTRSSTARTVLYDAAPPNATAISAPAAVNTSSVSVGMGATSDTGGSTVAGYAITASATAPGSYATAWAGGATTGSYALPSPASGTSYTYYLHVFDTLGNVRSSAAQTVVYDTDDPVLGAQSSCATSGGTLVGDTLSGFAVSIPFTESGSGITILRWWNGTAAQETGTADIVVAATTSSPASVTVAAGVDTTKSFSFRIVDVAGNVSATGGTADLGVMTLTWDGGTSTYRLLSNLSGFSQTFHGDTSKYNSSSFGSRIGFSEPVFSESPGSGPAPIPKAGISITDRISQPIGLYNPDTDGKYTYAAIDTSSLSILGRAEAVVAATRVHHAETVRFSPKSSTGRQSAASRPGAQPASPAAPRSASETATGGDRASAQAAEPQPPSSPGGEPSSPAGNRAPRPDFFVGQARARSDEGRDDWDGDENRDILS